MRRLVGVLGRLGRPALLTRDQRASALDIYLAHDAPAVHEANWLPTPTGAFYLSLRLYLPKPSVLDRAYRYPIVRRIR